MTWVWVLTFHDGGPCNIETSLLICNAKQWAGFYIIGTTAMKELILYYNQLQNKIRLEINILSKICTTFEPTLPCSKNLLQDEMINPFLVNIISYPLKT